MYSAIASFLMSFIAENGFSLLFFAITFTASTKTFSAVLRSPRYSVSDLMYCSMSEMAFLDFKFFAAREESPLSA